MKHDAMLIVRSGLINRIEDIAAHQGRISLSRLCEEVDIIRHDAHIYGLEPLERLASMLASALSLGGLGPVILSYLDLMRDAVACEDVSHEASTAYLAALSSRMHF
jgi:hypothetical protein